MNSKEMKLQILNWLYFDKGCRLHATEYKNGADCFGVNQSDYAIEVEIKCSISDFMSEIKTIHYLLDPESDIAWGHYQTKTGKQVYYNKFDKHRSYLISESKYNPRPRYFYFAVPESLHERAITELSNTPYGLVVVSKVKSQYSDEWRLIRDEVKKGTPLCSNKFTDFRNFALKTSNENYALRTALRKLEVSVAP